MNDTLVYKFGGSSLADAAGMHRVVELVQKELGAYAERPDLVIVVSAIGGTTDNLLAAVEAARAGAREEALTRVVSIRQRHEDIASKLSIAPPVETNASLAALTAELSSLLAGIAVLGECTPRARDRVLSIGEKLSARVLALAFREHGILAEALDADTFLETDDHFGEANPVGEIARRSISAALRPRFVAGGIPVVTGFCGRGPDGATTTLGRGGSDLSATLIAEALDASSVTLWSDVDGVYSADPRVVPEARVIPQLHYREAAEMSFYGAQVLHPRTMIPVVARGIPVVSRNTMAPELAGTVVNGRFTPGSHPVKAASAVRDQSLISLEGKGMSGVPGVASRLFDALAEARISVTMISQSSSESSICFVVPEADAQEAERSLKRAFRVDLSAGLIEEVVVTPRIGIVAVVGLGMAHSPGVASRVFAALGERRINVLAIAQGSSELNISLAIETEDIDPALRALHSAFGLDRIDTGVDSEATRKLDLVVLGFGSIARALIGLIEARGQHFFERFDLSARVVAVSDRSGYYFDPKGIAPDKLAELAGAKAEGRALGEAPGAVAGTDALAMCDEVFAYRLARPVLIDVSDADQAEEVFLRAFERGVDVVTANKKPLAGPYEGFAALGAAARGKRCLLRAEATVGAGLPVLDTLEMLLSAGDRLIRAEGALSGTLAFLLTRLEEGARFSTAVAEAARLGYTEPDPVVDLSGGDVGRKALILGRMSGLLSVDAPFKLEGLVPSSLAGMALPELLKELEAFDEPLAERVAEARERGEVLRYLARVDESGVEVGMRAVPKDSTFGGLHGTDNMIVFQTERYDDRPLVVTGPGAGVDVTAMGVLSDVMRVAAERR